MTTITRITRPKYCDFCKHPCNGARQVIALYDFKTRMGPWANACEEHYLEYRYHPDLGTGLGQRLVLIAPTD